MVNNMLRKLMCWIGLHCGYMTHNTKDVYFECAHCGHRDYNKKN